MSIKLSWIETLVSNVYKEWLSNVKKREKERKNMLDLPLENWLIQF